MVYSFHWASLVGVRTKYCLRGTSRRLHRWLSIYFTYAITTLCRNNEHNWGHFAWFHSFFLWHLVCCTCLLTFRRHRRHLCVHSPLIVCLYGPPSCKILSLSLARCLVCSATCQQADWKDLLQLYTYVYGMSVYTLVYGVTKSCIHGTGLLMCGEKSQASLSLFNKVCPFFVSMYSFVFCFLLPLQASSWWYRIALLLSSCPSLTKSWYVHKKERSGRHVLSVYFPVSVHLSIYIHT